MSMLLNYMFFEERQLPSIKAFKSSLKVKNITEEEYKKAQEMWKIFSCETFGDYHDAYLKLDVLLLAEVLLAFTKLSLHSYGLAPNHFISLPSYAWQCMLKMTGSNVHCFNEDQVDMHYMIEKNIRGGISSVCGKRLSRANHSKINQYNENARKQFLMYIDANNLYGLAMIQKLPIGDYEWEGPSSWSVEKIMNLKDDSETGYFFEVDLHCPKEYHDYFNDYPLACESIEPAKYNGGKEGDNRKLLLTRTDKTKYLTYYRNLKLYLSLGLQLTKIHRVISFHQDYIRRDYILFNTGMRQRATSDFEKDFYKLMNDAVFGKTMENVRKRINFELIPASNNKLFQKRANNPRYKDHREINENLFGVEMMKKSVVLDKPIGIGFSILELSKCHMYGFYYNVLKKKYEENVRLLYTDTDSLIIEVATEDIYKDLEEELEFNDYFDFSNYPEDSTLYNMQKIEVVDMHGNILYKDYLDQLKKQYEGRVELRCSGNVGFIEIFSKDYSEVIERIDRFKIYEQYSPKEVTELGNLEPYYIPRNEAIPGKFKDELGGICMTEFVCLRSKMYSFLFEKDGKDTKKEKKLENKMKKGKGIQNEQLQHTTYHDTYLSVLLGEIKNHEVDVNRIRSNNHELTTYHSKKKG